MITKEQAADEIVRGFLWSVGAVFVGLAIGKWNQRKSQDRAIDDFLGQLDENGWTLVRKDGDGQ